VKKFDFLVFGHHIFDSILYCYDSGIAIKLSKCKKNSWWLCREEVASLCMYITFSLHH